MASLIGYTRTAVATGSTNTTVVGTVHASTQVGDLLVACITSNDALASSSVSATDWTLLTNNYNTNSGTSIHIGIFYKTYTGTENLTFTVGGDTRDDQLIISTWRGTFDPTTPLSIFSTYTATSAVSYTAQSVTSIQPNSILLSFAAAKNGATANADDTGQPAGMTMIVNRATRVLSTAVRSALAYEIMPSVAASGTRVWSNFLSGAQYGVAVNFIINAAPATNIVDSFNSSNNIEIGQQDVPYTTTGFATITAITSNTAGITVGGIVDTSGDGTADIGERVDGGLFPILPSTNIFTFSDGTNTATISKTVVKKAVETTVLASGMITNDTTFLGYHLLNAGRSVNNGSQFAYVPGPQNVVVDGTGAVTADNPTVFTLYYTDISDGRVYFFTVTVNEGGVIDVKPYDLTYRVGWYELMEQIALAIDSRSKLRFVPDSTATTITEFRTDLNNLLDAMRDGGWFDT